MQRNLDFQYLALLELMRYYYYYKNVYVWSPPPTPLLVAFIAIQSFDVDIAQLFFTLGLLAPRSPFTG